MAADSTLSITVLSSEGTHTYVFPRARKPTLLALSCILGPTMFFPEGASKPYTNAWMPLEDLPRGKVVARAWTDKTIKKQNKFFIQQLTALVQDLDIRLTKVRGDGPEAAAMRELQNNLRATISRERT